MTSTNHAQTYVGLGLSVLGAIYLKYRYHVLPPAQKKAVQNDITNALVIHTLAFYAAGSNKKPPDTSLQGVGILLGGLGLLWIKHITPEPTTVLSPEQIEEKERNKQRVNDNIKIVAAVAAVLFGIGLSFPSLYGKFGKS